MAGDAACPSSPWPGPRSKAAGSAENRIRGSSSSMRARRFGVLDDLLATTTPVSDDSYEIAAHARDRAGLRSCAALPYYFVRTRGKLKEIPLQHLSTGRQFSRTTARRPMGALDSCDTVPKSIHSAAPASRIRPGNRRRTSALTPESVCGFGAWKRRSWVTRRRSCGRCSWRDKERHRRS